MLYNAFVVLMPEMEQSEHLLVSSGANPIMPFILQNLGIGLGYIICAFLVYIEYDHDLPW